MINILKYCAVNMSRFAGGSEQVLVTGAEGQCLGRGPQEICDPLVL